VLKIRFKGMRRYTDFPIPPACGVPPTARRAIDAALQSRVAAFTGVTGYWSRAIADGCMPADLVLDGVRWLELVGVRRPPRWASAPAVVRESPLARLRDFSADEPAKVVPTLVVPPQAGHDSCIVDYSAAQSQMQTIRNAGLERLYALDWLEATQSTKDATITDYLAEVDAAVEHASPGGAVNLVGDCQGGWLATIYAALHPERVNTLTIAGAPIDFHAGDAVIHDGVRALAADGLPFHRSLVALGGGVLKGELLVSGFIVIKPENEMAKQLQLVANIRDRRHVARYRAFEDWFKHPHDIPGAFYLWIIEHLFRDNELIRGALTIDGTAVDLRRIACPVNLLAGATDHITPPEQVFALAGAVSTPPELVTRATTSGGHLGLFMGTEALREHWPVVLASVLEHSRPGADIAAARRRSRARTPNDPTIPVP
jgi:poly(3-hydroxybutyrate) depolymerase